MPYKAKLTIKYDSEWSAINRLYNEEEVPEQHLTLEFPVEDLNTTQIFQAFSNFMLSMGYAELSIMKGACYVAFNEMRREEDMKKVAAEYDLVMAEELPEIIEDRLKFEKELIEEEHQKKVHDLEVEIINLSSLASLRENTNLEEKSLVWEKRYWDYKKNAEKEIRDLKAKLSRLENPDNPQYTDEEMNALCSDAEEKDKKTLVKKLQNAYNVCHDCGKKYGTYSVGSSSTYMGKCNVCEQERPITEARDYGWLKKGISELLNDV